MRVFLIIFTFFFFSCKKDKDEVPPQIVIKKPQANKSISFNDTIFIEGVISDETSLVNVNTRIETAEGKLIYPGPDFKTSETNYLLFAAIPVNDEKAEDENVFLRIMASDGTNTATKYIPLKVFSDPLRVKRVFASTSSGSSYSIHRSDSLLQTFNLTETHNGTIQEWGISSFYDLLLIAEANGGDVKLKDLSKDIYGWTENGTGNFPLVTDVSSFNKDLYFSFYNGEIRKFSSNSFPETVISDLTYHPSQIGISENYIASAGEADVNGNSLIKTYWKSGGQAWSEIVQCEVRDILHKSEEELFLLGNSGNTSFIYIIQADIDNLMEVYSFNSGKILSSARAGDNRIIVAHETGLYYYTYGGGLIPLAPVQATDVIYDKVNELIYCAVGTEIKVYSFTGLLVKSYSFSAPVQKVSIWYNR